MDKFVREITLFLFLSNVTLVTALLEFLEVFKCIHVSIVATNLKLKSLEFKQIRKK